MKRLTLFLLPLLLTSCASQNSINTIKKKYLSQYKTNEVALLYFGNFDSYEIVYYYLKDYNYATALNEVEIGDYLFVYPVLNEIQAFGEHEYTLKNLYDDKLISYENIGKIHSLYEKNLDYFSQTRFVDIDLSE